MELQSERDGCAGYLRFPRAMDNLMSVMGSSFLQHLIAQTRLADLAADRVRRVQVETGERLAPVLLMLGLLSEADLADEMARFSGRSRVEANSWSVWQ